MEYKTYKTKRELDEHRKLELKKLANTYRNNWIEKNPFLLEISTPVQYSTDFIQVYNTSPKIKTKTELESFRKSQKIQSFQSSPKTNHLNLDQRVAEREKKAQIFGVTDPNYDSSSVKKKIQDLQNFEKLFSKHFIGVHGSELPKFSENCKDYWKLKSDYTENPIIKTKSKLSRPVSEYSKSRPRTSEYEIPYKPTQINPFPDFKLSTDTEYPEKRSNHSRRFSEQFYYGSSAKRSPETMQSIKSDLNGSTKTISLDSVAPSEKPKKRPQTAIIIKPNKKHSVRSRGFK